MKDSLPPEINDGGPAFPRTGSKTIEGYGVNEQDGMSLRDYFAAKALQGLCANPGAAFQANARTGWGFVNCDGTEVAALAYTMAEAMLKNRSAS